MLLLFTSYFGAHSLVPIPCATVGVNEIVEQLHVSVYPNPATDYLQINLMRLHVLTGSSIWQVE
jgi:hypothetical protein